MEMDIIMTDIGKDRIDPKDKFVTAWDEGCRSRMRELKPDIIVADILGRPGWEYADEAGIPLVVNNPAGGLALYQMAGIERVPDWSSQAKNSCGKIVIS